MAGSPWWMDKVSEGTVFYSAVADALRQRLATGKKRPECVNSGKSVGRCDSAENFRVEEGEAVVDNGNSTATKDRSRWASKVLSNVIKTITAAASSECVSAEIYTDAQYILNLVAVIENGLLDMNLTKVANPDLSVRTLNHLWKQKSFVVHKIKSHRDFSSATSPNDLWNIVGILWWIKWLELPYNESLPKCNK